MPAESEPGLPFIMIKYDPAYNLDLFAAAGYAKVKDLVAILAPVDDRSFERLKRVTDIVKSARRAGPSSARSGWTSSTRTSRSSRTSTTGRGEELGLRADDVRRDRRDGEKAQADPLPPWVLFVELDGKPVGFHLALKDYNQVLKELGGSLFPSGG